MPEESRTRRLAILIDADNTSPRIAAGLFEEVAKFGEASVRRIYGDFSGQRLKSWAVPGVAHALRRDGRAPGRASPRARHPEPTPPSVRPPDAAAPDWPHPADPS